MELQFQGVSKSFHHVAERLDVLEDVHLTVAPGEFLCVLGPSGCGKSTLLNLAAGLESPDHGRVLLDGQDVRGPQRACGMIFQDPPLFPWLSVLDNVAFADRMAGLSRQERHERAALLLEKVGLWAFRHAWPHQLSGGMKQRVALAAALAKDPAVLLLDEPFAALDAQTRDELHEMLEALWSHSRKTVVFVTHNVREAIRLGDRVALLAPRGGKVLHEYKVDLPRGRFLEDVGLVQVASIIREDLRAAIHHHRARKDAHAKA